MCAVASSISWLSCATPHTTGRFFFLVARATRTPPSALCPRPGCAGALYRRLHGAKKGHILIRGTGSTSRSERRTASFSNARRAVYTVQGTLSTLSDPQVLESRWRGRPRVPARQCGRERAAEAPGNLLERREHVQAAAELRLLVGLDRAVVHHLRQARHLLRHELGVLGGLGHHLPHRTSGRRVRAARRSTARGHEASGKRAVTAVAAGGGWRVAGSGRRAAGGAPSCSTWRSRRPSHPP